MATVTIAVNGVEQVAAQLARMATAGVLERPMHQSVALLKRQMATYPSPPAQSRYRRTGTLGRRWTTLVRRTAGGVEGVVGNNTVYAPFVQSRAFQARVHRGRWQTDANVLRQNERAIAALFEAAAVRAANAGGLR